MLNEGLKMVELLERETSQNQTKTVTIKVCMGTTCFANGNTHNLDFIRSYVQKHGIDAKINLCGSRCEGKCAMAPTVIINEEIINYASPIRLEAVLKRYIKCPSKIRDKE